MKRRPMCLVCLLLMLGMYVAELAGFPLIRGNPLPDSVQTYLEEHPDTVICGEVQRCQAAEYTLSVYLNQVYLMFQSEQIPIENVRVFLKTKEKEENFPVGTQLEVSGKLERTAEPRNPGEFDARQYYACQKIYYFMKNGVVQKKSSAYSVYGQFMYRIKQRMKEILNEIAGEDAGVFQAMILGEKENLEEELKIRYQMAGIIHILAISGVHISVLGMGLFRMLKKLGAGNILAGMVSLGVLLQYGILTGGSASAMRAVVMFLLTVGGVMLGRSYDLLTALAVSAVVLLIDTPAYLNSSSFLLSFGAVVGLGCVAPILYVIFGIEKNKLMKSLLSSVAVQLVTLPILMRMSGEVSLTGVFLNLFVLPTAGTVLGCGILGIAVGLFSLGLAKWCILPGKVLLVMYEKCCVLAAKLPFCTWIGGAPEIWQCVLYYGLLLAGMLLMWKICEGIRKKKLAQLSVREEKSGKPMEFRKKRGISASVCAVCIVLGIWILGRHPCGKVKITCLDVGQGDCIEVAFPEGQHILIDGGSSSKKKTAQYQILPYLKNQRISVVDAIMISHTDEDHISGVTELLEMIEKNLTTIRVCSLILPDWEEQNTGYRTLVQKAQKIGISVLKSREGKMIHFGDVKIEFLTPFRDADGKDPNEDGMVLELSYGKFRGLFTGDIGEATEKSLLEELEDVSFLKVGHHGSRYSTCQEFLDVIKPETAVISCSKTNTYGHPAEETVQRLKESGAEVFYTMQNGAVFITTDGQRIWTDTFIH